MKIQFPRTYLAAAAQFMADSDIRYYLNGMCVEVLPTETRLVATDGHICGVLRWPTKNETIPRELIIPAATVALVCKMKGDFVELAHEDGRGWSLDGVPFAPVDGKFPAYRRIIITRPSGEAGHYRADLIARFAKAGKALKRRDQPIIRQNGTNGALVHFYAFDDFIGVLMPMNHFTEKSPDLGFPTWAAS